MPPATVGKWSQQARGLSNIPVRTQVPTGSSVFSLRRVLRGLRDDRLVMSRSINLACVGPLAQARDAKDCRHDVAREHPHKPQ